MELHIPDLESYHYFFIIAVLLLSILYVYDIVNDKKCCQPTRNEEFTFSTYDYSENNGPSFWSKIFIAAEGKQQSPINLLEKSVKVISFESTVPLLFSKEFNIIPSEMKVYNNSHNIVLYGTWANNRRPSIVGGPLTTDYCFVNLRFRWGPNDYEGSEHMINFSRFSMELQAAFIKSNTVQEDILTAAKNHNLLIVSYVFMVTSTDNPYLEPIINAIEYLKLPMSCLCIEPVTLSLLMPVFERDYFCYVGSLSFPPCTEGVLWIVKPEPLMISSQQVKQFRKVCGYNGRIKTNTRPVQPINGREVLYYD
ncbi:carbonic anhydrase 13-like [Diabrotica undecimpunctata]|uniref:carbonic anhydrase 13-like n=1 Tax=Diabrotica undecimpunctata TaxID=50387 RepID=UPI003B6344C3